MDFVCIFRTMNTELVPNHVSEGTSDTINDLPFSPPFTQGKMFLTGYTDCAQEALWYLTEVEKLPPNHPTVVGLKVHLHEQYRMFQMQHLLLNVWNMCDNEEEAFPDTDYESESDGGMKADDTEGSVTKRAIHSDDVPNCENTNIESGFIHVEDMKVDQKNNNYKISAEELRHDDKEQGNETESELSPEAHMVALALAEEIYSLLQSRNETDEQQDYSSSTDDESIDEVFDEMIDY